jgi:hypothetical protein
MMPCSLVDIYEYFEETCCFQLQGRKVILLLYPEDGSSRFLQNGEYLPEFVKSHLRKP